MTPEFKSALRVALDAIESKLRFGQRPAAANNNLRAAKQIIAAAVAEASEAGIPASVQQDRQDAERWREALMNVGGIEWMAGQRFVFRYLEPIHGANIMFGSVAEHFTQAIDAALAARKELKP